MNYKTIVECWECGTCYDIIESTATLRELFCSMKCEVTNENNLQEQNKTKGLPKVPTNYD